jgi:hypothetical protein
MAGLFFRVSLPIPDSNTMMIYLKPGKPCLLLQEGSAFLWYLEIFCDLGIMDV